MPRCKPHCRMLFDCCCWQCQMWQSCHVRNVLEDWTLRLSRLKWVFFPQSEFDFDCLAPGHGFRLLPTLSKKKEKLTSPNGYDLSFIPTATCSKLFASSKNENCLILGELFFYFLLFEFWVCLQLLNQRPAKIYYYFYIFRRCTRAQNFKYIFSIDLQVNFAHSCKVC